METYEKLANSFWGEKILSREEKELPDYYILNVPTLHEWKKIATEEAEKKKKETARKRSLHLKFVYPELKDGTLIGNRWRVVGDGPFAFSGKVTVFEVRCEGSECDDVLRGKPFAMKVEVETPYNSSGREFNFSRLVHDSRPILNLQFYVEHGKFKYGKYTYEYLVSPLYSFTSEFPIKINLIKLEREMRAALKEIHDINYTYNDFKPSNIYWDSVINQWVLGDFELVGPGTKSDDYVDRNYDRIRDIIMGTEEFMAPGPLYFQPYRSSALGDFGTLANVLDYFLFKIRGGNPNEWVNPFQVSGGSEKRVLILRREPGPYLKEYLKVDNYLEDLSKTGGIIKTVKGDDYDELTAKFDKYYYGK